MNKKAKILILGSTGMVGSALVRQFHQQGFTQVLTPKRSELDLFDQKKVMSYFEANQPDYVVIAAAKVGGILDNNTHRADFIFQNLQIQQNVFNAAFAVKTPNLLFLGSSCIYPKNSPQPIKEEYLLTSSLEATNEPYAIAKIAGLKTAQAFRHQYQLNWVSVMPTNLYGFNDNYDPQRGHVIPGLIARMDQAIKNGDQQFKVWGSGKPRREFLFSDDLAKAIIHVLTQGKDAPDFVNIGSGSDIEIGELAKMIAQKMGFKGELIFDTTKPDGTMRKLLDSSKIFALGWRPEIDLEKGLDLVIKDYRGRTSSMRNSPS